MESTVGRGDVSGERINNLRQMLIRKAATSVCLPGIGMETIFYFHVKVPSLQEKDFTNSSNITSVILQKYVPFCFSSLMPLSHRHA